MGIAFVFLARLRSCGVLPAGSKVLDIGSSNLYSASSQELANFIADYKPEAAAEPGTAEFIRRLSDGSDYSPETGSANESFVGELLDFCGLDYTSFDIAAGYNTKILDLNRSHLPEQYRSAFDLVLNFGTTEHVMNQLNSFEIIHDATRVGGCMAHQLPVAGHTDHGYFLYTGRLFFDLAGYNGYEIVDLAYEDAVSKADLFQPVRSYASVFPRFVAQFADRTPVQIPDRTLTVIYRKTRHAPFKLCLETSTSVGEISDQVRRSYQDVSSLLISEQDAVATEVSDLHNSTSWAVTAMRVVASTLRWSR